MTICPFCDTENIEGEDFCEGCGQSLSDTHLTPPSTEVERSLLRDRVNILEPRPPFSVPSNTAVKNVLREMVDRRIGCVLVVDGSQLVGIFSERDALRKLNAEASNLGSKPVAEFMTPQPQTVEANAKIAYAVQRMDLGGYRHLPVVGSRGELSGVISARDIIGYLTSRMSEDAG